MDSIELKAFAKINLSLDVIGKRADGYHEVRMIMQTIGLHDRVIIEATPEGIEIDCKCRYVPTNENNIAYKAAKLLMTECGVNGGVKIKIEKNIPVAAGLAGGSTDAAAVLKGLNGIFDLGLSDKDLMVIGKQIGADVPYCIVGGTMLAEGIGEILTPLATLPSLPVVLVKPKIGVSTAWVYGNLDLENIIERPDTDLLTAALQEERIELLAQNMKNVLETVTLKKHTVIGEIKDRLLELGALGSMMSGSGPTVFGIFKDTRSADAAYDKIKAFGGQCYLTETIDKERLLW